MKIISTTKAVGTGRTIQLVQKPNGKTVIVILP